MIVTTQKRLLGCLAGAFLALHGAGGAHALDLGFFGDLGLVKTETGNASFRLGHLDFYAAQKIDEHTRALFEMEVLTLGSGNEIEIQRFWIMREFSDHFQLGAGRFHTPIGYWSRQFHHGKLLKPTVTRPFILGFERSANAFLPMHMIGLMAEGEIFYGLEYELGIANSNTMNSSPPPAGGGGGGGVRNTLVVPIRNDLSSAKSVFGRLSYDVFGVPFKPGISVMRNDVLESAAEGGLVERGEPLVRQTLLGLDLRYAYGRLGMLSEVYRLENDARPGVGDGRRHSATAWFVQFSYDLTENLKATVRHEVLDYEPDDPYFTHPRLLRRDGSGEDKRDVAALRYDLSESNALKVEVSKRPRGLDQGTYTTIVSWEFVIY